MRKTALTIILILSLALPAKAFAPLAIPLWYYGASAVLHVAAAVGLYYAMTSGGKSQVNSSGDISRPSKVAWIDLTATPPALNEKSVHALMTKDKATALSEKNDSNGQKVYPNAYNSLHTADAPDLAPGMSAGVIAKAKDGNTYKINNALSNNNNGCSASWSCGARPSGDTEYDNSGGSFLAAPYDPSSVARIYLYYDSQSYGGCPSGTRYCGTAVYAVSYNSNVPKRPDTPIEAARSLSGSETGGDMNPALQAEFDKMYQDPDYVPTFSDDTTGLPFTSPPSSNVATPAQVQAYNANGQASASAQNAASAAGDAATNAGNAYTASGGNLATGQGGDPSLYQKYLDALAGQQAAQAAADKLAAEQTQQKDSGTDDSTFSGTFDGSTPYGDQTKDFNFGTRFQTFVNDMKNTAIFSLPNQFLANIPSSSTSTMTFSGGRFGQFTYDFSQFDNVFMVLRSIILVLFGWVSVKIVLLKGGS